MSAGDGAFVEEEEIENRRSEVSIPSNNASNLK